MNANQDDAYFQGLIKDVSTTLNLPCLQSGGPANTPASELNLVNNKIHINPDVTSKLTEFQIKCIIAHELGHANTRFTVFGLRLLFVIASFILGILLLLICGRVFSVVGIGIGLILALKCIKRLNILLEVKLESIADDMAVKFAGSSIEFKSALEAAIFAYSVSMSPVLKRRLGRL